MMFGRLVAASLLAALLLPTQVVRAVVVLGTPTGAAPSGYANLGFTGAGSAIYLGNRWVLTAQHVEGGVVGGGAPWAINLPGAPNNSGSGNKWFGVESANYVGGVATNYFPNFKGADLCLVRLVDDPGLSAIQFGRTPTLTSQVAISGMGYVSDGVLRHYRVTGNNPAQVKWSDVTSNPSSGQFHGYNYGGYGTSHWGTNATIDADNDSSNGSQTVTSMTQGGHTTQVFTTRFDGNGPAGEAQPADSDSGGAVFQSNRLVGVVLGKFGFYNDWSNFSNQGLGQYYWSAMYSDTTSWSNIAAYADLHNYVDDIASKTGFHPSLDGDANLDGLVDRADYDLVYAHLLQGSKWTQGDFNLDGTVDLLDLQILQNHFGEPATGSGSAGLAMMSASVPEPGATMLIAIASIALVTQRRRRPAR